MSILHVHSSAPAAGQVVRTVRGRLEAWEREQEADPEPVDVPAGAFPASPSTPPPVPEGWGQLFFRARVLLFDLAYRLCPAPWRAGFLKGFRRLRGIRNSPVRR